VHSDYETLLKQRSFSRLLSLGGATLRYQQEPRECIHGGALLTTLLDRTSLISIIEHYYYYYYY